jgi:phosphocarrier protein
MRVEKRLTLVNPKGFHVRPAAMVAEAAALFESEIHLLVEGKSVNAKSTLHLLMLAAEKGTEVVVTAEGDDAQAAVDAIEKVFVAGFNEMDEEEAPSHQ